MRFTPGCCWCDDGVCDRCDSGTVQSEYDVTFFPGQAEEFTLTVSNPVNTVGEGSYEGYGCCTWSYVGTISDFPGFYDDGNGDCDGDTVVTLSLGLIRGKPNVGIETPPCGDLWPNAWLFYWSLRFVTGCEPPQIGSANTGIATATGGNSQLFSGQTDVTNNETVDCSLTGDNTLTFDGWSGTADDNCDGPVVQGCLDCTGLIIITCDFPSGGAEVTNAA